MTKFDPNQVTFAEGEVRVQRVLKYAKVDISKRVMTSHDEDAKRLKKLLPVTTVPDGFEKWQLPFVFDRGQFFISVGKAGHEVGEHVHSEGQGIRFILSGSIMYQGKELKAGDWMYIPQGVAYSFKVGPHGATMGYCYQCCCGGFADIRKWLSDPGPDAIG
jgi:hypothetical protein